MTYKHKKASKSNHNLGNIFCSGFRIFMYIRKQKEIAFTNVAANYIIIISIYLYQLLKKTYLLSVACKGLWLQLFERFSFDGFKPLKYVSIVFIVIKKYNVWVENLNLCYYCGRKILQKLLSFYKHFIS